MDTLRYRRRRILCARIPVLLLTLLPALGLAAAVMPALWQLVQGPRDLYAMTPSELEGAYAAAEIDTIWDWYADTVVTDAIGGEAVTAREYLVPLSDGRTFIGVQVPARMIPAGDRVLEQTGLWRSNPAAYLWDGSSLTVRGGVRPMDEETRELYYHYLQQVYGLSGEELDNFLPLVLVQGKVRGMDGGTILLLGLGAIAFFALTGVNLSRALRDARLQQITDYCRNRPYPEEQVQILDAVVHLGKGERGLSAEDGWLINLEGPRSWMLQHEDVAWIYISRVRQVRHGSAYRLLVYSRSEPPERRCHEIFVQSAEDGRELIDQLVPVLPGTVFGYSPEREQAYRRDPAGFGPVCRPGAPQEP